MTTDILSGMMTEAEFLEHSGVKGMKWGERKDASYKKRYDKELGELKSLASNYKSRYAGMSPTELNAHRTRIQSKLNRMDMNTVLGGMGYGAPSRVYAQAKKRGDQTPYQKLSATEKNAVDMKTRKGRLAKATATSLAIGAIEIAAVVGGGNYLISKSNLSAKTKQLGRQQTTLVLGGTIATIHIQDLMAMRSAARFNELSGRRWEIDKELTAQSKKSKTKKE